MLPSSRSDVGPKVVGGVEHHIESSETEFRKDVQGLV
jgi:hypothetical protein